MSRNGNGGETPKGISRAERETVIRWDEEEETVTIWSASTPVIRKLRRLGATMQSESRRRTGELHGMTFTMPLGRFSWGLRRKGAALSEAHRLALRKGRFSPRSDHVAKDSEA